MLYIRIIIYSCCFICLLGGWMPIVQAQPGLEPQQTARALFLQAETALKNQHVTLYKQLKRKLSHYPLLPYLIYQEYVQRIQTLTLKEFQTFIEHYPDSLLSEQLRSRWLQAKAQQKDWQAFLSAYQPTEDLALQCHYLMASLETRSDSRTVLNEIAPLWLSGKQHPKCCEAVFAIWEKSGLMTTPQIWQRIKALLQEGNGSLARKTAKYLKKSDIALVELWLMVRNNPYLVTHQKYFTQHPANLEMIVDGVSLIAKTKPETAIKIWQQINHKYPFAERHWGLVVRAIGLSYAFQRHPDAETWLSKVPDSYATQPVHEWRIRAALAKKHWANVLYWISILPAHLANTEAWQYWLARALNLQNRREESQQILTKLAKSQSYYGFLASHQLLKPYPENRYKMLPDKSFIQSIAAKHSILRARELYALGRVTKANAEWQFTTQRMTDKEKHAAAHLALQWDLPYWAIVALASTNSVSDNTLRFPLTYAKHIIQEAQKHKLDPAWIFAITRQESAFVPHAKSSAGAIGLMQLVPSTAHMVAHKHQIPYFQHMELLEPYMNIRLGSSYLKIMLDQYRNNVVLATAAYNAGPGRVQKWLPSDDMAADVWIEIIPFQETRDYVKKVLAYTAIYQEILGQKPALARHMPYIYRSPAYYPP